MDDLDPIAVVERGVPKSVRQHNRRLNAVIACLFILFLGASVVAAVALNAQADLKRTTQEVKEATAQVTKLEHQIQAGQARSLCRTKLQADFEAAVGEAFSAPPAPNPLRDAAVANIGTSADALSRSEELCP